MFLICDTGPGRKGGGRLNPNKQTSKQPCRAPCATTALELSQPKASHRRGRDGEDVPGADGSTQPPGSGARARQALLGKHRAQEG